MIARKTEALTQASAAIAQRAMRKSRAAQRALVRRPAGLRVPGPPAGAAGPKDDVVDAEFEEVKDKDRRAS